MNIKLAAMALIAIVLLPFGNSINASAKPGEPTTEEVAKKEEETPKKIVVKVKAGDTLDAIAKSHSTTYVRLFNANSWITNPDLIDIDDEVVIPKEDEELPDRFSTLPPKTLPVATSTTRQYSSAPLNSSSYYVGNGMWCTDYVHSRRPDVPIYSNAGYSWLSAAQAQGKATGTAPRPGAVAIANGHVAYVESVNSDGSYVVSEMGWNFQAGNYNQRTVQPGTFGGFIY